MKCQHEDNEHKIKYKLGYIYANSIKKDSLGNKKINYSINDKTIRSFTVDIVDTTKPQLTIQQKNFVITKGNNFSLEDIKYEASDNGCKSDQLKITKKGTVDINSQGTYTITILCEDLSQNVAEDNVFIKVEPEAEKEQNTSSKNDEKNVNQSKTNESGNSSQNRNASQYNQKFDLSIDGYDQANEKAESLLKQGLIKGYDITPKDDGVYLYCY